MKNKKQQLEDAVCVSWEEFELGWGTRPDGFSLHLTESHYHAFVKSYSKRMSDSAPNEYSRPAGKPMKVRVSRNLYLEIKNSGKGMRRYDEEDLVANGDLIFVSARTGWVPI